MSAQPINVVDLFAGCGGLTQGFRQFVPKGESRSPFRSVAAVEFDVAAATTYAANFSDETDGNPPDIWADDIEAWYPADHLTDDVEVILGGPPCQGFSGLGKEDPEDPRNKLWRQYVRIVKAIRPKVFVIENVDRFLRSPEYKDLVAATADRAGAELREYELKTEILNAADYGVPQARRRVIAIATHRDLKAIDHPAPTHRKPGLERPCRTEGLFDISSENRAPWVPVDHVLSLPQTRRSPTATELPYRETTDVNGRPISGVYLTHELHIRRNPTALSLARYAAIGPGGNRHDLRGEYRSIDGRRVYLSTESWDRHNSGAGDVMGRLRRGEPAVTIRTEFYKPEKGRYLHPTKNRPLTHLEAALIQGFPMDYKWCGTKAQIARQIGNAVPTGLGRAIAEVIYERLRCTT